MPSGEGGASQLPDADGQSVGGQESGSVRARREDDALLGGITLANVRRGVAQSCTFGYWIGKPFARLGYMTEAVHGACGFSFDHLRLHRVEAATLPHNTASQGVLRKSGFREEGLARSYLKIDGKWQDHRLFALLRDEYDPRARSA